MRELVTELPKNECQWSNGMGDFSSSLLQVCTYLLWKEGLSVCYEEYQT